MTRVSRRGVLLAVVLTGGLTAALIFGSPSSAFDAAGQVLAHMREEPYPPGFEQPYRPIPSLPIQGYVQEEAYPPGFEQAHPPIPPRSIEGYVQEEAYPPGFEQPHN